MSSSGASGFLRKAISWLELSLGALTLILAIWMFCSVVRDPDSDPHGMVSGYAVLFFLFGVLLVAGGAALRVRKALVWFAQGPVLLYGAYLASLLFW